MSQMLPAFFTTTNTKKRKVKKSQSTKQHEEYLLRMGCHPNQLKDKKALDNNWAATYSKNMKFEGNTYNSAGMSGNSDSCAKRGVLVNLHKETEVVRKEILEKANRIQPLYNKGGLQYVTDGTDLHDVGKKK